MKKRKNNTWTIVLLISIVSLFVMALVSNAIAIGERLRSVHAYLEVAFYIVILFVVLVGIVYPIVGVFMAPVFSLDKLRDKDGSARQKWCRKLVDSLIDNVDLTPEEQEQIQGFLKLGDETDDKLIEFYDRKISPQIDREIFDTAKKVLIVTAVSQNSMYDMISMASANFYLIKRIIEICGFRPNNVQVMRIFVKVFSMTMLAGALEELNIEELIPMVTEGAAGKALGLVAASAAQGVFNALTTLRIGVITKHYLLDADVSQTRKELRKKSYKEAFVILRDLLKNGFEDKVKEPAKSFFNRKKDSDQAELLLTE